MRAKTQGSDTTGKKSVFGQIYRQLHFIKPQYLRCASRSGRGGGVRPWSVTYMGEGGTDAGGLFRDSLSHMSQDLQSESTPLFTPCPNTKITGAPNQEKWVPTPTATSSLNLSMYSFLGKLMGCAIRGRHYLGIDIPSIVWKPLANDTLTRSDIQVYDVMKYNMLNQVATATQEEAFDGLTFTTSSSAGATICLKPNGDKEPVTMENREEWVQLMENYCLGEFSAQVEAIKRGLATIVPIQLLPLFTWHELEERVCGRREIDIEFLKANTVHRNCRDTDPWVGFFWDSLRSFTQEQRQKYLRFVWGQSRLPLSNEAFEDKMKITPLHHNNPDPDTMLPVVHTCFFTIDMPAYTNLEVTKAKLLYAIGNCEAIDMDYVAENVNWDAEDD